MSKFICLIFTILILFCSFVEINAQETNRTNFGTIRGKAVVQKTKKTINSSHSVKAKQVQKHNFVQLKPNTKNQTSAVKIVQRIRPINTVEYWDRYIQATEKNIEELIQLEPTNLIQRQKLENALEKAKIRKALISQ